MRLQKIRTYYSHYLKQFYAARPGLARASAAAQFRELMDDCFAAADYWSQALVPHGYEIFESVSNAESLQRQWAAENGAAENLEDANWLLEITARQVRQFAPTVLFVVDYATFSRDFLRQLRADNPSIRCILGWCGAAYSDATVFEAYDIVLSCVPELVRGFQAQGHRAIHLNHAFAPQILEKIDTTREATTDFSFIGSLVKGKGFHNERERLLVDLIKRSDLQIWADVPAAVPVTTRAKLRGLAYGLAQAGRRGGIPESLISRLPVMGRLSPPRETTDPRIAARAHPALWGRPMYQQLHDSKVSLNTHIDISPLSASNMRLYEATGAGSCLLTEWRENLPELFEPDVEVATYRNAEECIEKVNYLLGHAAEREEIARAGQRRTLRQHTYTQWAERFNDVVRSALN